MRYIVISDCRDPIYSSLSEETGTQLSLLNEDNQTEHIYIRFQEVLQMKNISIISADEVRKYNILYKSNTSKFTELESVNYDGEETSFRFQQQILVSELRIDFERHENDRQENDTLTSPDVLPDPIVMVSGCLARKNKPVLEWTIDDGEAEIKTYPYPRVIPEKP